MVTDSNPGPDVGHYAQPVSSRVAQVLPGSNLRLAHFQGRRLELLDIGVSVRKSLANNPFRAHMAKGGGERECWAQSQSGVPIAGENTTHVCNGEERKKEWESQGEEKKRFIAVEKLLSNHWSHSSPPADGAPP